MNGTVNRQNNRTYSPLKQPPKNFIQKKFCREKVSVWMGLCGSGLVVGPIFYQDNLNANKYLDMLNNEIIPSLQEGYGVRFQRIWWMQDGAPCHRGIIVKNRLKDVFGDRIIGVGHDVEWPPRSPDLTPCDFFLWGHLKNEVYKTPPTDLQELRNRIIQSATVLKNNPEMIKNAMRSMRKRCQKCLENGGGHYL